MVAMKRGVYDQWRPWQPWEAWQQIAFTWMSDLVAKANGPSPELCPADAFGVMPTSADAERLSADFEKAYTAAKAKHGEVPSGALLNLTTRVLIWLYRRELALHSLWVLIEVGIRLSSPVVLREFLRWLQQYSSGGNPSVGRGWGLAVGLGALAFGMAVLHHRLFWVGMRAGFTMRQQCVAAVHAKVLRLNAAAVAHISQGHIVNLVAGDTRRFDDAMPFWVFLWAAPLELGMVLLMIALELGIVPALAGISATLALIPIQALLVRPVANIRSATAQLTDERVRLASEVIQGALAMKMMGWELPFSHALAGIRAQEAQQIRRMARIRAVNMALNFCITPVVSFVTFGVYRAMNGTLNIASVFYALSLLNLPKLYMVQFFVLGVQCCTELRVSLRRMDTFFRTEEPALPGHGAQAAVLTALPGATSGDAAGSTPQGATADTTAAAPKTEAAPVTTKAKEMAAVVWHINGVAQGANTAQEAAPVEQQGDPGLPTGYVALRGADYDWQRPLGHMAMQQHDSIAKSEKAGAGTGKSSRGSTPAPPASEAGDTPRAPRVTLRGVDFELRPGELLGVCGEVGSGKSSILAALLGELLPLPDGHAAREDVQQGKAVLLLGSKAAGRTAEHGPIVVGRVAYCAQVPWIVAGTVKDNILFGQPYDPQRYKAVIQACALEHDIASLPAGDDTELGERGINLSGGQKARVALGRAAYARTDISLLDDPLSAVDPRVGRTLFSQCIGPTGIMKGSTRVLVTHQRQFLPQCDRLLVLRRGEVLALGTWQEIAALNLPELTAGAGGLEEGATVDELVEADQAAAAPISDQPEVQGEPAKDEAAGAQRVSITIVTTASSGNSSNEEAHPKQEGDTGPGPKECQAKPVAVAANGKPAALTITLPDVDEGGRGGMDKAVVTVEVDNGQAAGPAAPTPTPGSLRRQPSRMRRVLSSMFARGSGPLQPSRSFAALVRGRMQGQPQGPTVTSDVEARPAEEFRDYRDPAAQTLAATPHATSGRGSNGAAYSPGPKSWVKGSFHRVMSRMRGLGSPADDPRLAAEQAGGADSGKLVRDEERAMGNVPIKVYLQYAHHIGPGISTLILVSLVLGQCVYLASDVWLATWSKSHDQGNARWLWVYGMLSGLVVVVAMTRSALFFEVTVTAATRIHDSMARTVFRAPLSFFHTNPAGRILNRFSKDLNQVDDLLPTTMFDAFQVGFMVLSALVLIAIAVPFILPVFVPLLVAFVIMRAKYLATSREVKRWEAITRSPVFASFSATLKGLPTIRAYAAQARFQDTFLSLLTHNGAWWHGFLGVSRWVGFRMDIISAFALMAATLLAMATRARVQYNLLALALSYVLQLSGYMQWFVRQSAEVENYMTSMERMLDYTPGNLPQEPPLVSDGAPAPPAGWPKSGTLEYKSVTAIYRAGLPPVLSDITFTLKGGSACGVVGRTGSGKSSLMLTLFRLIPVTQGNIYLDGLDTASIGLDALRRQLAIIPQDPVLFSGSVRSNLDPWHHHEDQELWAVLGAAKLHDAISAAGGLSARMSEAGDNLSVGQRQLFCLARALLSRAKVLALDEATANVDRGTDALIQGALREFAHDAAADTGRVILIIAHRIDTIMDTDHLLVLQAGRLVEQGAPTDLAGQAGGLFAGMVSAAYGGGPKA